MHPEPRQAVPHSQVETPLGGGGHLVVGSSEETIILCKGIRVGHQRNLR